MTDQKRTDTPSEWAARLEEMWEQMEQEGVSWNFTTCCCGEGLRLIDNETKETRTIY